MARSDRQLSEAKSDRQFSLVRSDRQLLVTFMMISNSELQIHVNMSVYNIRTCSISREEMSVDIVLFVFPICSENSL